MAPSRNSIRSLAEREETMQSSGAGLDVSPPPVPASMAKIQGFSELDVEMMDDLANILRGNFLDVQADAATAVAGLTSDREFTIFLIDRFFVSVFATMFSSSLCYFVSVLNIPPSFLLVVSSFRFTAGLLKLLSQDGVPKAANDPCTASTHLVTETQHRPARPAFTEMQRHLKPPGLPSMGIDGGGTGTASTDHKMSRECMRALAGCAECQAVRSTVSDEHKKLMSNNP